MPNNYLSVIYKHIIQVENKNVGLSVCVCVGGGGGPHKITIAPNQKGGGHMPSCTTPPPPPRFLRWLEIKYMCCKTKHIKTFFTFVVCMYTTKFLLTTEIK